MTNNTVPKIENDVTADTLNEALNVVATATLMTIFEEGMSTESRQWGVNVVETLILVAEAVVKIQERDAKSADLR